MRGRRSEQWQISESQFTAWLAGRAEALAPAVSLRQPSVRTLAALALLDQEDKALTYEELHRAIVDKKVLSVPKGAPMEIPILTLRVGVSDLAKALRKSGHRYQLRLLKEGREVRLLLSTSLRGEINERESLFALRREPTEINEPRGIARALVRYGGNLPFGSLYATYRAAAWWLSESTFTATKKKDYEAEALDKLQLRTLIVGDEILLVGLAPGEGLGEVEIIDRLLHPPAGKKKVRVRYLAVDSSDILLLSHSKLLAERFAEELRSGELTYVPVVGDIYRLPLHISNCWGGSLKTASSTPVMLTYFGNCLGNDENREWDFFQSVLSAFSPKQRLITVVGVSLLRYGGRGKSPIEERYRQSAVWLETPRHLLHDLQLLRSRNQEGELLARRENDEFSLSEAEIASSAYIPSRDYETAHGVKGKVYRVNYTLKHLLETQDGTQRLGAGEKLLLYSIVKYDLGSLQKMLTSRGLEFRGPQKGYDTLMIKEGEQSFHYAVFAAIRNP